MSTNSKYGNVPNARMSITHEVAPLGDTYQCTKCNEIFYTFEAAQSHENKMMQITR